MVINDSESEWGDPLRMKQGDSWVAIREDILQVYPQKKICEIWVCWKTS